MSALRGKTVIVTGATGYLADEVSRKFRNAGANVIGFTRGSHHAIEGNAVTGDVSGNLRQQHTPTGETLFQRLGQADLIVNCAAVVSDSGRRGEFRTGNIATLENILSVLSVYPNTKLVHVSSVGVYDLGGTVREETEFTRSRVFYRRTKRMGHELLRERMDERITIATPDLLYGMTSSGMSCPHYPQRLRKILDMPLPLSLPKGGNGNAGLTHVRNAADALLILAEHLVAGDPRVAGHEFIVSDMNKVTWGQWFRKWGEIFNIPKEIGRMSYHLFRMLGFANEILHRITFGLVPLVMSRLGAELFNGMTCDSSRLRALGWHPTVSYEDGMREVQEYYTRTS